MTIPLERIMPRSRVEFVSRITLLQPLPPARNQARKDAILIGAGKPAVADGVSDKDRRQFPGLAHRAPPDEARIAEMQPSLGAKMKARLILYPGRRGRLFRC
jgi:hypothetical protein